MVTLETLVQLETPVQLETLVQVETLVQPEQLAPDTEVVTIPELVPFFYWVPCAGVKCYTFDYRPALKKRIEHWAKDPGTAKTG
jgi:hypothetical protein